MIITDYPTLHLDTN